MPSKFSRSIGLRIIACSAAGVLLSLGMCGLGFYFSRDVHDGAPPGLDIFGFIGLVLSAIGVAVGIVVAIFEAFDRRRESALLAKQRDKDPTNGRTEE